MKTIKFIFLSVLMVTLVACSGNKNPQQNIDSSLEQKADEEREAKLAAKRAKFYAQNNPMNNLSEYNGKIKLTVMVPDEGLGIVEAQQLESKMIQMVTVNGVGGLGGNPRFVIAPDVTRIKHEVTSTAPTRHLVQYDITFYVADILTGALFGSSNCKVTGVGDSENLAFLAAFNELKPTDASFQQMLNEAQEKIIRYYRENGANIVQEARMLVAKQDYVEAMALLGSIPVEADSSLYIEAITLMDAITPKYLEKECGIVLRQLKASLGNQANGVNKEAMVYYSMIPQTSTCKADAEEAYKDYKAKLSANDQREWEKQMSQIRFDNEFKKLNTELQAKIQMSGNKCLLDKYKKDAAYNRLPWLRKVFHLGNYDPFDGYTPEEEC